MPGLAVGSTLVGIWLRDILFLKHLVPDGLDWGQQSPLLKDSLMRTVGDIDRVSDYQSDLP